MTPESPAPPPLPEPAKLRPDALSNRSKRWMFLGVMGVVLLIVLANIIGSPPAAPVAKATAPPAGQQLNPTHAQITDLNNNLIQQQAELLQKTTQDAARFRQLQQGANTPPDMTDQLARLEDAQARAQRLQPYGIGNTPAAAQTPQDSQKAQLEAQQAQQERQALFADNLVRQTSSQPTGAPLAPAQPSPAVPPNPYSQIPPQPADAHPAAATPDKEKQRKPLDFDPSRKTYWLPEGTVIEAVLTNRLDGEGVGPVNCMTTTDVYLPGTRLSLIPQGSRVLGEASKVSALGQQRLAVAFHRIIVPGLHEYSIPLDARPPALAQAGEVGLKDKVNSHYFQIFGASLAVGAIGGLAQIGNGQSGFGYDPSVQFRNGVTASMAQSSERILDRFLNRLPTITIREGTRTKILLTDDLQLPAYERTNE